MIAEIEGAWRETGIPCENCGGMTYSDGQSRPQCCGDGCLALVSDERIWTWLITYTLSELDEWERAEREAGLDTCGETEQ